MRILVAGGAGFIGSHLTERLVNYGHDVTVLDNFCTGKESNLEGLDVTVLSLDVTSKFQGAYDLIYHLASRASPIQYQKHPLKTAMSNTQGTVRLLEKACRHNTRMLFASTSEVYGNPTQHPQPEAYNGNVNPVGPRSCYDESKRMGETFMMDFHRGAGVDIRIARIFNTYGPRLAREDGRVVSNFITQALENKPITIYGDGSQTRSFCYVSDMVSGLLGLMACKYTKPMNLGNPLEISILLLAQEIIDLTGSKSEIVYQELPEDDPVRRCPDISLARAVLGWKPKISIATGLKQTIDFFKSSGSQSED